MLVLTRKKGQSVIIGKEIRVFVVEVAGETVRLGIEAPPEVEIFRSEIYQQLREENTVSVASAGQVMGLLKLRERKDKKIAKDT